MSAPTLMGHYLVELNVTQPRRVRPDSLSPVRTGAEVEPYDIVVRQNQTGAVFEPVGGELELSRQSTVPGFGEGHAHEPQVLDASGTREVVVISVGGE
ncbi:hypothetical protein COUCH_04815 [Couchioplanes caeruleus]|uniref:hypothetical protein n=1 Tax=Couchioplanes caeruleus TaxID=56438 RepID=UPI0020BE1DFD|nr:hypothetical protein [Couchioplanes caeruleus]UQU65651.1 hypothetical protein COUCH_04815 [Couchioplanes caeruleus]